MARLASPTLLHVVGDPVLAMASSGYVNSGWGKAKGDIDNRIYLEMKSWAASTRAPEGDGFEVGSLVGKQRKKPGRHSEQLESIEKKIP